jgi:hypothetical protein
MNKEGREPYKPPKIIVYTEEDLLEEIGPAQTCSPFNGAIIGC